MTPRLIFVIAKDYTEFKYYAQLLCDEAKHVRWVMSQGRVVIDGERDYRFIFHADKLRGFRMFEVVRWGNWSARSDLPEIEAMCKDRLAWSI